MKHLCVLGSLLTENGKCIKAEMLSWLTQYYNVFCIDQEPPGKLFEYPAIYYTIKLTISEQEPVLYVHTKGAAYPTHQCNLQDKIRKIWQNEFTINKDKYFGNYTGVITPYTGPNKETWFNAFVLYPDAALELCKTFHIDSNRFYYERMFCNTNIQVHGVLRNDLISFDNNDHITQCVKEYKIGE